MPEENIPQPNPNPADNQQGSSAQPIVRSGGQKVIQPSSELVQEMQAQQQVVQSIQPVTDINNPVPVQVQPQAIYPQPATSNVGSQMHVDGQPVAYSANSQILQEKRHLPWPRIIKWSLFVIVIAGIGSVLATNQNIRATVFRQKFVTYNYPICKTHVCTVKFYRGSKIGSYTPVTPPGETPLKPETTLLSPIIGGKTYLAMLVSAYPLSYANTSSGKQLLDTYSTCSAHGLTSGFTVYVTNLDANANVCAIPGNIGTNNTVIGYVTAFVSQKADGIFLISINENFNINSQGQATTPIFNLADHQDEMQDILASLNSKNK